MGDKRRGVSRRGLFGVFRKPLRDLKDGLEDVHRAQSGQPRPATRPEDAAAAPSVDYERVVRPPEDLAPAEPAGPGSWTVDLAERRIEVGSSVLISGGEMPEPVILVRVHAHHWAACSCECPVDGSDILWAHDDDRLRCPGCASEWRLDGESLGGPASFHLARFVVDAYQDDVGGVEVRRHLP